MILYVYVVLCYVKVCVFDVLHCVYVYVMLCSVEVYVDAVLYYVEVCVCAFLLCYIMLACFTPAVISESTCLCFYTVRYHVKVPVYTIQRRI